MTVQPKRILVVDKQDYWRKLSVGALEDAGFVVTEINSYAYSDDHLTDGHSTPDLIILGCATIGPEELALIQRMLDHKHRLLVLSTSLPWRMMRSIFLLGAEDVADKPYDSHYLLEIVESVLGGYPPSDVDATLQSEIAR